MKNTTSYALLIICFLAIGCSTSKRNLAKISQQENPLKANKTSLLHVTTTTATEDANYKALIDNKFIELENLALPFAKIDYNKKEALKYDCEINILFDALPFNEGENTNNKHFSKVVKEQQTQSDNAPTTQSVTVRGYVHQRIEKREVLWNITITTNPNSNNCKVKNSEFVEHFTSKSIHNTLSGDERALSKKYKEPIAEPLLSRQEMTEEAINNVYKKIEFLLKKNY